MSDEYICCPKDPKVKYLKEVCENIFRKETYRTWCKTCRNFQEGDAALEKPEKWFQKLPSNPTSALGENV